MRLREYFLVKAVNPRQFWASVGVSSAHGSRIMSYKALPSVKLAKRIEIVTDEYVKAAELITECMYYKDKIDAEREKKAPEKKRGSKRLFAHESCSDEQQSPKEEIPQ